jgi:transcriptional regulator with GAF, ATPase, and Fis domain/CHASE2 domain-containing sensor protein
MPSRWMIVGVVGLLATSLVWSLTTMLPQLFGSWEMATYDLRMRWQGAGKADPAIVLIGRDEESDARFGAGIWDRAVFAQVIAALGRAGARTIALDFHMPDVSPLERGNGVSDQALLAATSGAGTVLYPMAVASAGSEATAPTTLPDELNRMMPLFDSQVVRALPRASRIEGPLPSLAAVAAGVGHIAAWPDEDGVYRHVPAFVAIGDRTVPALGVVMAASVLRVSLDRIELGLGDALRFRDARWPDGRQRTFSIPVDAQGRLLIRYTGHWTDGAFPYLSFVDVWDAIAESREAELREQVAGKLVILLHAALGSDKRRTPYEVDAPGGFILANVANTILTQHGLRELGTSSGWLVAFFLGLGAAAAMTLLPGWGGPMVVAALGLSYAVTTFVVMGFGGLVLPVLSPLVALTVASLLSLGWTRQHAADRVADLENEQLALHRALATKQVLLAQQETRADQLEEDVVVAKADAVMGVDRQTFFERTIASLQQQLQAAQWEADETRFAVKELEGRLAAMKAVQPGRRALATDEQEEVRQECVRYGIVTGDPALLQCWKDLKRAARSEAPILILGEPGTGKELFAQAVHRFSERAAKPFVAVNMAAVPPDLFESQLFGHLRGSFTGSVHDHEGYFLQADKGTIFLDEIGDLRSDLQAKLLRVLQEGVVTRVGDRKTVRVDVRVVSATNRDLLRGIAEGWFREDLYYRLHGIELQLPPLRERHDDIAELAMAFIEQATAKSGRTQMVLSHGAMERLKGWPWKGNVRELKRCLENAVILTDGTTIFEQDLRLTGPVVSLPGAVSPLPPAVSPETEEDPRKSDQALLRVLREHSFDLQATATTLGWDRSTVMQRLKGMCFQALVQTKGDQRAAAASLAGEPGLTRLVEVKLKEYVEHLRKVVATYPSQEAALIGCRKRFKNLPERYQEALATLVRLQSVERD